MTESELLQMRHTVNDLIKSHNQVVGKVEQYEKHGVAEKAMESHYLLNTLVELLVEKGIFTAEDVQRVATRVQLKDLGLTEKDGPSETGDVILIKFQVFDGDKLLDDQTKAPFNYVLGSGHLSCEPALVGIKKGEQRTTTVVFGPKWKLPEYAGKELTMVVLCTGVMIPPKDQAA